MTILRSPKKDAGNLWASAVRKAKNKLACRQHHRCIILSSAPEDGRNYRPKHVELIEITNRLLLLHLVGCLYHSIHLP